MTVKDREKETLLLSGKVRELSANFIFF